MRIVGLVRWLEFVWKTLPQRLVSALLSQEDGVQQRCVSGVALMIEESQGIPFDSSITGRVFLLYSMFNDVEI